MHQPQPCTTHQLQLTMYHIHIDVNITYLHLYINKEYSIRVYHQAHNLPGDNTLYSWDMIDTLTIAQDMTYLLSYMMCMSMNRAIMYHLYTYSVHDLCIVDTNTT